MRIDQIRKAIQELIDKYQKQRTRDWTNERIVHYEFFKILFSYFTPEEIRECFKWEYPIVYKLSPKPGAIDIIFEDENGKWIAIEIEYEQVAKNLRKELNSCIEKLKSRTAKKRMEYGFIVPLVKRPFHQTAKGQGKTYKDMIDNILTESREKIGSRPIEIVQGGIISS